MIFVGHLSKRGKRAGGLVLDDMANQNPNISSRSVALQRDRGRSRSDVNPLRQRWARVVRILSEAYVEQTTVPVAVVKL